MHFYAYLLNSAPLVKSLRGQGLKIFLDRNKGNYASFVDIKCIWFVLSICPYRYELPLSNH